MAHSVKMLPPHPDACQECAAKHDPQMPHNRDSLYFQYRFFDQHGRWPEWSDAMTHCTPEMRAPWKAELERLGKWSEPVEKMSPTEKTLAALDGTPTHSKKQIAKPGTLFKPKVIRLGKRLSAVKKAVQSQMRRRKP